LRNEKKEDMMYDIKGKILHICRYKGG